MERPIEQQTLREMLTNSERLARELIEHLEQGFLPKVQRLNELLHVPEDAEGGMVRDVTIRTQATTVLETDQFSQEMIEKMEQYLAALDNAITKHINRL